MENKYYIDPLLDAYKNSNWPGDKTLFEKDAEGKTVRNFSEGFLNTWKDVVDNWGEVRRTSNPLIVNDKLASYTLSVFEIIQSYETTKKVYDQINNKKFYEDYLQENKHLYELMDMPGESGRMQIFIPFNGEGEGKIATINQDIWARIYRVGDSLVTFYDFLEDIKREWKSYFPDAVKIILRRDSLKRFYGVTDINPEGGFYRDYDRDHRMFADCSIRYFYLMPDGNLISK